MLARDAMKTRMPLPLNAFSWRSGSSVPPPTEYHGSTHPTSMTTAPTTPSVRPRPMGRRCTSGWFRVDLGAEDAHEAEIAVQLAVVQAIAHDELVGNRETDVVDRDLDEPPGGLVEQRADPERPWILAAQVADEVVERQPRVDDVLDDQDLLTLDASRQVLQDSHEP